MRSLSPRLVLRLLTATRSLSRVAVYTQTTAPPSSSPFPRERTPTPVSPLSKGGLRGVILVSPLSKGGLRGVEQGLYTQHTDLYTQHISQKTTQAGLTLIECLVAIIIVALTILAITPPILLATGTRVQSRRAEQANQIAQAEVDRVRSLMERGITDVNLLPASAGAITMANVTAATPSLATSPLLSPSSCGLNSAPGGSPSGAGNRYPASPPTPPTLAPTPLPVNTLVRVDIDGDCQPEFVMQVFRNNGQTANAAVSTATTLPSTFDMGVRVYSYFSNETLPNLGVTRASLVAGTNARDRQVATRRLPLAVLYTTLSVNTQSSALGKLCQQQQPGNTACNF